MQTKNNSVTLLMLIILGVAIGNLTSSWLMTKINKTELEKEAATAPEALSEPSLKAKEETSIKETRKSLQPEAISESAGEVERETVKLSPKDRLEPEEITPAASSEELIEQRRLDENGLRLSKKCNEWTTVHKDMNTPSSERGMNKHCAEYYDYLSFGSLPDSN